MEFFPDIRNELEIPLIDDEGLRTHTLREDQLIDRVALNNLGRFLIALNWTGSVREGEGIDIRERVIQQLNAALPDLSAAIDFTVSTPEFTALGSSPSPANQLLAEICFYPENSPLCDPPPTQEEIDNAPPRPEDGEDIDPDIVYSEDLAAIRSQIIDSIRTVTGIDDEEVQTYLSRELNAISTTVANRYYLDEDVASHPATDTALKQVKVRKIGADLPLQNWKQSAHARWMCTSIPLTGKAKKWSILWQAPPAANPSFCSASVRRIPIGGFANSCA